MQFQFYRFYLLIILAASIVVWSFNEVIDTIDNPEESYAIGVDYLLDAYQDRSLAVNNRTALLPQFTHVDVASLALPEHLSDLLMQGKPISIVDENQHVYYYRLAENTDQVVQLGPVVAKSEKSSVLPYLVLLFYSCLAVLLLALMRPLFRDLHRLQDDADQFGRKPVAMQANIKDSSSIYPLAKAFNRMSTKIVEFIEMNKDLSRAISHEIRTPLTRMKFMLAIISEQIDASQKQQIANDISEIELLVNDYLSFSKMEGQFHSLTLKQHSMKAFLKVIQQKFAIYQEDISIEFDACEDKVYFNSEALALATQNLLTNALRYASKQITIRFYLENQRCYLTVEDDGPGVVGNGKALMQPFLREDDHQKNHKGFGLGLYIVQKISILHEGEFAITRSSTLGGAKMTLSWPNEAS